MLNTKGYSHFFTVVTVILFIGIMTLTILHFDDGGFMPEHFPINYVYFIMCILGMILGIANGITVRSLSVYQDRDDEDYEDQ